MKNIIKTAIAAIIGLGLGSMFGSQAQAYPITPEMKQYIAEMPELSYQSDIIDCKVAGRVAAQGAWWAMNDPGMTAEDMDINSHVAIVEEHYTDGLDFSYLRGKTGEEIKDTYQGFFASAAIAGYEFKVVDNKNYHFSQNELRKIAKDIGQKHKEICEMAKEASENGKNGFKSFIALYRVSTNKL